jgi:translation initiation factor 5
MGSLNVNRKVTDLYYRYKMPRICAKVEGKGNGIKTVIVNMGEVAKALNRPATYPTKYFGCELGAQIQFDYKNERFIVNGAHEANKLQDLLDGFISKYVLCPECDNPETDLLINAKKETISQTCKACGYRGMITVQHKLNTFILKNPPNINPAAQGASLTEGKRSKRSKKGENDTGKSNGESNDSNDFENKLPVNGEADEEDDDANWTTDVSEEAVRARMLDLTDGAKNITISEDNEKTEKQRMDILYEFIKKRIAEGKIQDVQTHKEIHNEAVRLEVQQKAPLILAELLFSENITADAKKHRNLLLRFTNEETKAQKYLIGGIEQILALHSAKLIEKTAGILKFFYDNDLLEEKVLLEWGSKVSKKYVAKDMAQQIHDKAMPFIKWLQEAEEESDEESDDDDVEIGFDDRAKVDSLKNNIVKPTPATKTLSAVDDDDDEELDIDNI